MSREVQISYRADKRDFICETSFLGLFDVGIFFRTIADITEIFFLFFIGGPKPYIFNQVQKKAFPVRGFCNARSVKKLYLFYSCAVSHKLLTFIHPYILYNNQKVIVNRVVTCFIL